ncbi:MAG TPA: hypothetical protein PKC24_07165 [Cyclobacteriaceae bacterium]|mgnify:CR=1 FL=1|nr:hypothetical protein [Cyclobacteriaceae bacterium]
MKRFNTILFLFCCLMSVAHAQNNMDKLLSTFSEYYQQYAYEKVFISTDKSYYAAGEELYFSIFLLEAASHTFLKEESYVYLYLLQPDGMKVDSKKIKIKEGIAYGSFTLADTLSSAVYELQAYNIWMSNFSDRPLSTKRLRIEGLNELSLKNCEQIKIHQNIPATALVKNIPSALNLSISNACAEPLSFTYKLYTADTILLHHGKNIAAGVLHIEPFSFTNDQYLLQLNETEWRTLDYSAFLKNEGASIVINEMPGNQLRLNAAFTENYLNQNFYVVAHSRGEVYLSVTAKVNQLLNSFVIKAEQLNTGINVFSLFSENFELLAENIFYVAPQQNPEIKWLNPQTQFTSRNLEQFRFQVTGLAAEQLAHVTASVFKKAESGISQNNISDELLWASDLQIMQTGNPDHKQIPSLWNRKSLLYSNMTDPFAQPIDVNDLMNEHARFDLVKGTLLHKSSGLPMADSLLVVSVVNDAADHFTVKTDANGNFSLVIPKTTAGTELFFNFKYGNASNYKLITEEPRWLNNFRQKVPTESMAASSDYYHHHLQHKYLNGLYEQESCEKPQAAQTLLVNLNYDAHYLMDEYNLPATVEEVLLDILSGVRVRTVQKEKILSISSRADMSTTRFSTNMRGKALLLLDGIYLNNQNYFFEMTPSDIESISVIYQSYVLGDTEFAGVLSVITKNPEQTRQTLKNVLGLHYAVTGFGQDNLLNAKPCEVTRDKRIPDLRYLLAWEPHIITDADGNFSFFAQTSDDEGEFIIRLEGITSDGRPLHAEFNFNVSFSND